ncbi:MAG: hypothetical protein KKE50_02050 [Nanoarchaeota archaeon]|nr:hypothetical protein [Nanoarchaeota archaeon]
MEREKIRIIVILLNIFLGGLFLFSLIRVLYYGACWFYPIFNLGVWITAAISTVINLRRRK